MAGASIGYPVLWLALVTFPLMAAIQFICAKIALVYGTGLTRIMREQFPRFVVYPAIVALVVANTINAAADIQAIAAGINLLAPIPILALILPVALLILLVQIWGSYRLIVKIFRWLTLSLFAYIGASFLAHPNWTSVLRGTLVPSIRFDSNFLSMLVALLGTTISPYLFFWQANQEIEEEIADGKTQRWQRKGATPKELKFAAWDVITGMFLSNVVMYFIILATAATLHTAGKTEISTATEAADALRPIAGNAAYILMAFGLIGTGILAVPILTGSAAYSVAELCGWKCSLDAKPWQAKEFYVVIIVCTLAALAINYLGVNPMQALFWTAVINGFLAPPLLIIVMLIASNSQIMGKRSNGLIVNTLGWTTTVAMFIAAIVLVWTWIY
ncbi:MAG TPA: divalent metal cation transporter [Pirellulales bacterium]|jgi:NRAMP (natural resistance-associated macrophage protein)-like metal ion transporter|nr:divalent metal cation transporter [Pirellulales bacterium]